MTPEYSDKTVAEEFDTSLRALSELSRQFSAITKLEPVFKQAKRAAVMASTLAKLELEYGKLEDSTVAVSYLKLRQSLEFAEWDAFR